MTKQRRACSFYAGEVFRRIDKPGDEVNGDDNEADRDVYGRELDPPPVVIDVHGREKAKGSYNFASPHAGKTLTQAEYDSTLEQCRCTETDSGDADPDCENCDGTGRRIWGL